jgi:hypothetical protein
MSAKRLHSRVVNGNGHVIQTDVDYTISARDRSVIVKVPPEAVVPPGAISNISGTMTGEVPVYYDTANPGGGGPNFDRFNGSTTDDSSNLVFFLPFTVDTPPDVRFRYEILTFATWEVRSFGTGWVEFEVNDSVNIGGLQQLVMRGPPVDISDPVPLGPASIGAIYAEDRGSPDTGKFEPISPGNYVATLRARLIPRFLQSALSPIPPQFPVTPRPGQVVVAKGGGGGGGNIGGSILNQPKFVTAASLLVTLRLRGPAVKVTLPFSHRGNEVSIVATNVNVDIFSPPDPSGVSALLMSLSPGTRADLFFTGVQDQMWQPRITDIIANLPKTNVPGNGPTGSIGPIGPLGPTGPCCTGPTGPQGTSG